MPSSSSSSSFRRVRSCLLAAGLAAAPWLAGAQQADPAVPAAAPAPVAPVPAADPDTLFKGKMGGTFGKNVAEVMPAGRRIAVAGFRVAYVLDNRVTAQVRAAHFLGRDSSGANSSFFVALQGVSPATLQAVTDRAHAEFLRQLAASGREVVPPEQVREALVGARVTPSGPGQPYTKEHGGQTASFFTPEGMPLLFTHAEGHWGDGGMLDLTNYRKLQEASGGLAAVVITPLLFVNFARMRSSGNQSGLLARSAETGAELAMAVTGLQSMYVRTEEFRNGMLMKGDEGSFQMTGAVDSPLAFGTLQVTQQEDNAVLKTAFDLLGRAAGMANAGGAVRNSTKAVAATTDEAYAAAASDALARTAEAFGRWWRQHPAAP